MFSYLFLTRPLWILRFLFLSALAAFDLAPTQSTSPRVLCPKLMDSSSKSFRLAFEFLCEQVLATSHFCHTTLPLFSLSTTSCFLSPERLSVPARMVSLVYGTRDVLCGESRICPWSDKWGPALNQGLTAQLVHFLQCILGYLCIVHIHGRANRCWYLSVKWRKIHFWKGDYVKFNYVFTCFPLSLWVFWGQGHILFFFHVFVSLDI